jgi:hypothetical protein
MSSSSDIRGFEHAAESRRRLRNHYAFPTIVHVTPGPRPAVPYHDQPSETLPLAYFGLANSSVVVSVTDRKSESWKSCEKSTVKRRRLHEVPRSRATQHTISTVPETSTSSALTIHYIIPWNTPTGSTTQGQSRGWLGLP